MEHDKATEARLEGRKYTHIIDKPYRWESWAAPKDKSGKLDHNHALTGDDLLDFVNRQLFPYLQGFKAKASGPNTIEYKIGEIFSEIKNRIQSGYNLRDIIDPIDGLRFLSQTEKHELSHLYEAKIKNMGNAGRNGGEYYTPRPLIRAIIKVVDPRIGETIYDGAVGSGGFLCEAFDYLKSGKKLTTKDLTTLQTRTFYGKEKKSLAYVIAIMNMILHGIEAPNIIHTNTLTENLADVQAKDQYDVVLANPPFGGKERPEVQQNFHIRTGETAFLFLQHFIRLLKAGGRGGIVIKNTFLSNTDNASVSLRKLLLQHCTRAKLLEGLEEKGFGPDQLAEMQKVIDAENSDLFDVLAHVAYALPTLSREQRAVKAKVEISTHFNSKQQVFLDFVLSHYVGVGVEELEQAKLAPLLKLRYHNSINDAVADLGEDIGEAFTGFQKYLYQGVA